MKVNSTVQHGHAELTHTNLPGVTLGTVTELHLLMCRRGRLKVQAKWCQEHSSEHNPSGKQSWRDVKRGHNSSPWLQLLGSAEQQCGVLGLSLADAGWTLLCFERPAPEQVSPWMCLVRLSRALWGPWGSAWPQQALSIPAEALRLEESLPALDLWLDYVMALGLLLATSEPSHSTCGGAQSCRNGVQTSYSRLGKGSRHCRKAPFEPCCSSCWVKCSNAFVHSASMSWRQGKC